MKIVVTDGFTLNPGDLSWNGLEELGEVRYFDRTAPEEMTERLADADIVVTNKTPIGREILDASRHLKMIAVTATGFNIIDVNAAKGKGVCVCNVPEYGTHSVAQHTIALMLAITNRVCENSRSVLEGNWSTSVDWSYSAGPLVELKDKILGIVGLGRIGNQTAKIAAALGMNVIYHRGHADLPLAEHVELDELFRQADFVSLHCPLRQENEKFVNTRRLNLMKKSAYLINSSRGQLIDELALRNALIDKKISGAALDVLSVEPPPENHPLVGLQNCIITPHTAWLSKEARSRIMATTVANVKSWINGTPQNVVS